MKSNTRYFTVLWKDSTKMSFFRTYISAMQFRGTDLGSACCYADSTLLPNEISDNPFNAHCCYGVESSRIVTWLGLVLDEGSDLPVWYDIIHGNECDISTT